MRATKGCSQLTSNDTYFYYIWFSGVKEYEEAMAEGVYYSGKDETQGFFPICVIKFVERVAGGFLYCYE